MRIRNSARIQSRLKGFIAFHRNFLRLSDKFTGKHAHPEMTRIGLPGKIQPMLDLFLRSSWHFLLHFGLGAGLVLLIGVILVWLSRRWLRIGDGLPGWALSTSTVCLGLTIFGTSLLTGLQTGAVGTLSRLIETESRSLTEQGLLLAGKPLGIASIDQKFGVEELNQLAEQYAPEATQKSKDYLGGLEWLDQAEAQWQRLPEFVRKQAEAAVPRSEWNIRELVDLAYREMVVPAATAARWQAWAFAASLAAALIGAMLCIDLLLRWLSGYLDSSRRKA